MAAKIIGARPPPANPCKDRKIIISSILVDCAHPMLAAPNTKVQVVKSHRVDINLDSHPAIGIIITSAIRADVRTQLTSSGPAARPPLISSNELPTICILSTAKNIPIAIPTNAIRRLSSTRSGDFTCRSSVKENYLSATTPMVEL